MTPQEALLILVGTTMHEYLEYFGGDSNEYQKREYNEEERMYLPTTKYFGPWHALPAIFDGYDPTYSNKEYEDAKNAIIYNTDPNVLPVLPKN